MTFKLSRRRLAVFKTTLRNISPAIGSSHADEALAFAFGFKTHASLRASLGSLDKTTIEAEFVPQRLIERLEQLNYGFSPPVALRISLLLHEALTEVVMTGLQEAAAHAANDNKSTIAE